MRNNIPAFFQTVLGKLLITEEIWKNPKCWKMLNCHSNACFTVEYRNSRETQSCHDQTASFKISRLLKSKNFTAETFLSTITKPASLSMSQCAKWFSIQKRRSPLLKAIKDHFCYKTKYRIVLNNKWYCKIWKEPFLSWLSLTEGGKQFELSLYPTHMHCDIDLLHHRQILGAPPKA